MLKVLKQIKESLLFAVNAVIVNKLRTFLSLLGITIGIFAIITVFTIIDSLESSVRDSLNDLGSDVVYIQKWPWGDGGEYPWWKYFKRPNPTLEEAMFVKKKSASAYSVTFNCAFNRTVKYKNNSIERTQVRAASSDFEKSRSFEITNGRFISSMEFTNGRNVAVLGGNIAKELFVGENPVGKSIKVGGKKTRIIGVFEKEGENAIGETSIDELVYISANYAKTLADFKRIGPWITVSPKENIAVEELMDELRGIMRSIRRLKPKEEDTFALNQISLLSGQLDNIFKVINLAGGIIGGFSLLVGGFGIANIMFVSVRERTSMIGIEKALGAKRYFILLQFLFESVMLTITGGAIGLLLIYLGTLIVNSSGEFTIILTSGNIVLGLSISAIIGVVSGFVPALQASKLDPVVAMSATS